MKVKIDGIETILHVHASPIKDWRDHWELAPSDNSCAYSFKYLPQPGSKIRSSGQMFEFANDKGEFRK